MTTIQGYIDKEIAFLISSPYGGGSNQELTYSTNTQNLKYSANYISQANVRFSNKYTFSGRHLFGISLSCKVNYIYSDTFPSLFS